MVMLVWLLSTLFLYIITGCTLFTTREWIFHHFFPLKATDTLSCPRGLGPCPTPILTKRVSVQSVGVTQETHDNNCLHTRSVVNKVHPI